MKARTTLCLLAAVCAVGAAVWLTEKRDSSTDRSRERETRLIRLAPSDIRRIEIARGDLQADCMRADGDWRLAWPPGARADEKEIEEIIGTLCAAERREVITASQRRRRELSWADYGLAQPRARVAVHGPSGVERLILGADAPLGDGIFARLARESAVIATARRVLDVLPAEINVLRDRAVMEGDAARVTRLEISRAGAGFLQIARSACGWFIQQPIAARADDRAVQALLDALYGLRVRQFVWDPPRAPAAAETNAPPAGGKVVEAFGLAPDEAVARVGLGFAPAEAPRELFLGRAVPTDGAAVYARLGGAQSVYAVERGILDTLAVSANDLRDRRLFPIEPWQVNLVRLESRAGALVMHRAADAGWTIAEPVKWKADDRTLAALVAGLAAARIARFVDHARTNLVEFGLADPIVGAQLREEIPSSDRPAVLAPDAAAGAADGQPARKRPGFLWFGNPSPEGDAVFARFEDAPYVFEVPADALRLLGPAPLDPKAYRDRTVLALTAENVRSITIGPAGREQTVERATNGAWVAAAPGREALPAAVESVLFAAANLRAAAIEAIDAPDPGAYGLAKPAATVTFGLSGQEGIRKTLLIGSASRAGKICVMVQGVGVIFALDAGTAAKLTVDLTRPSPAPPPAQE